MTFYPKPCRLLVCGASESGKTFFVNRIVPYMMSDYDEVFLFSASFQSDPDDYGEIIRKYGGAHRSPLRHKDGVIDLIERECVNFGERLHVIEKYTPQILELIAAKQRIRVENSIDHHVLIICDDLVSERGFNLASSPLVQIACRGRHWNISLLALLQFTKSIAPGVRQQCGCVAFQTTNYKELESLNQFFGFGKTSEFQRLCDKVWSVSWRPIQVFAKDGRLRLFAGFEEIDITEELRSIRNRDGVAELHTISSSEQKKEYSSTRTTIQERSTNPETALSDAAILEATEVEDDGAGVGGAGFIGEVAVGVGEDEPECPAAVPSSDA